MKKTNQVTHLVKWTKNAFDEGEKNYMRKEISLFEPSVAIVQKKSHLFALQISELVSV